jgi:O-antigen/teichoic acid export membrane protein
MISNIAALFLSISDRYILSFTADFGDVGLYSLGSKMANTITVFIVGSVSLALSPKLFRMMDEPDNKRFYSKVMTYYAFGLIFFVLGMSLFGKEVIKVLAYSTNYWDAYRVIPILSFSIFFAALKDIALIGLLIEKRTKTIALIIPVITLLNIGLNILLTHFMQYIGSAYAALISQIIYFVVVYIFAQRTYYIPYEYRKLLLITSAALILYSLASLSNDFSLMVRLIAKTMAIVSFPFVLYLFKFYEPIEIKTIKKIWNTLKRPKEWKNLIRIMTEPS